jgi:cysteine synthase
MSWANDIRELVGRTPMLRLNHLGLPESVELLAKLELFNPGGSVKDRIGLSMLEAAERSGALGPGGAVVEATAGNTGIGVALAALGKGYRVVFAVPEKFSAEKVTLMRALGAEIIRTPESEGMEGARRKASELLDSMPGAVSLDQFENPANPRIHYETTGPEILEAAEGRLDYFVAGAGSGGTYSGVMRFLRERLPGVKGVLVDPLGSTMGGGECGRYAIEGIGNSFVPGTMDMSLVDEVIKVSDAEALEGVRLLALKEGVVAGSSSGAAIAGALRLARKLGRGRIAVVLPDRGDRYFSKNIL